MGEGSELAVLIVQLLHDKAFHPNTRHRAPPTPKLKLGQLHLSSQAVPQHHHSSYISMARTSNNLYIPMGQGHRAGWRH